MSQNMKRIGSNTIYTDGYTPPIFMSHKKFLYLNIPYIARKEKIH